MIGDELLGHTELVEGLWRAAAANRLPHALIFEGSPGVGKFLAARRLAAGLMCEKGPAAPCGTCGACRRIDAASHPDLFVVDPPEIEVLQIKYVTRRVAPGPVVDPVDEFLALRPAEGGWRIVLIRDFDRANEPAQNALLKLLEEPGDTTLLVLETSRPDRLLATILSRCSRIRFGSLDEEDCARVLDDAGLKGEEARVLSRWSGGAPGRAIEFHKQAAREVRAAVASVLAGEREAFAFGAAVSELGKGFRGATEAARARSCAAAAAELALAVLADLARHSAGVPADELAHGDLCERFGAVFDESELFVAVESLLRARQDIDSNLDPGGVLDRSGLALGACRA